MVNLKIKLKKQNKNQNNKLTNITVKNQKSV